MYMSKLIIFQQEGYDAVAINPAQVTRVEPVETHIEWSDIHMSDGKVVVVEETFHMAVERLNAAQTSFQVTLETDPAKPAPAPAQQ